MVISGDTLPELYTNVLIMMRLGAKEESSRNGPVLTMQSPVHLILRDPTKRVLYDPIRKANPFFHVMETIWMLAGKNDVKWLEQFNSRYRSYAEPETDLVWAAYGHRWRNHFGKDQIVEVRDMLKLDPTTRRAVIAMWDPRSDLEPHNDLPCNTHLYFRVFDERLHMTILNRSNDAIWGALGANAVHMTMLQQLIAEDLKLKLGYYHVITNNLHVYKEMPNFEEIFNRTIESPDLQLPAMSLLQDGETMENFLLDAVEFVDNDFTNLRCSWFIEVAVPMFLVYMQRKIGVKDPYLVNTIQSQDWRKACRLWVEWKNANENTKSS